MRIQQRIFPITLAILTAGGLALLLPLLRASGDAPEAEQPKLRPAAQRPAFTSKQLDRLKELEARKIRVQRADVEAIEKDRVRLIGEVLVEAKEICAGEDVLVQATALDPSEQLSFRINNARGNPAVVRYSKPGTHHVRVEAHNKRLKALDAREAEIVVNDCPGRPRVLLGVQTRNIPKSIEARVLLSENLGKIQTYVYDFGDGKIVRTSSTSVFHTYAIDEADKRPNLIVTATAIDEDGVEASGRAHYTFINERDVNMSKEERIAALKAAIAEKEAEQAVLRSYERMLPDPDKP